MPAVIPANEWRETDHERQDPDADDEKLGPGWRHEAGVADRPTDGDVPVDADCYEVVDGRRTHPDVDRQPDATPATTERPVVQHLRTSQYLLDTALLECVSEDAVRAYTTPDSAVSYLNHAQIAKATPSFAF